MRMTMLRNEGMSKNIHSIRRVVLPLVSICAALVCHVAAAQLPQIVRWDIKATVIDIVDPLGLFPDVRLGDPVRGMLKYDASIPIDARYLSFIQHEPWFGVTSMSIQNPRNGTEFNFETDPDGDFSEVNVFNGFTVSDEMGPFDGIYAPQSVLAPAGFAGTAPVVNVSLTGPPTIFPPSDDSPPTAGQLPATLHLNDWPFAQMEFQDGWFSDPTHTRIAAEIYSLTSVTTPHIPGDYNFDGTIDAADYIGWRYDYGVGDTPYADGSRNGLIDGPDYVIWRKNRDQTASVSSIADRAVPEPPTLLMSGVVAFSICLRRRRRHSESFTCATGQ